MAKVPNGVKHCRKFQSLSRVHERYRQTTDRQTDGRTDGLTTIRHILKNY